MNTDLEFDHEDGSDLATVAEFCIRSVRAPSLRSSLCTQTSLAESISTSESVSSSRMAIQMQCMVAGMLSLPRCQTG